MASYPFLSKPLFKVDDIKGSFISEATLWSALRRLQESGEIKKLKGGLYARVNPITDDIYLNRFEIATSLYEGSYCAYHTALEYHGLATRLFSDVHVVTKKRYKPMMIENLEFQFFQTRYMGGIDEIRRNAKIRVTELERTVVDCLDRLLLSGGIEEVYSALLAIPFCDEGKLLTHLSAYGKKTLYKKAGYLFSRFKPKYLSDDSMMFARKTRRKPMMIFGRTNRMPMHMTKNGAFTRQRK